MNLPPWAEALLAVVVFLVGGGTVGKWLAARVRSGQQADQVRNLRETFATKDELNGFRTSMEGTMKDCRHEVEKATAASLLAVQNAELALATAQRIDTESKFRWESIAREMSETARTLERVTEKVQAINDAMIRVETENQMRNEGGRR